GGSPVVTWPYRKQIGDDSVRPIGQVRRPALVRSSSEPAAGAVFAVGVLILRGGRVVDPRSGTEQVADVAVDGGSVVAVAASLETEGATVVDVTCLGVGPGFVDLHSHVHSIAGQRLQALDGVTATLDLEAGLMPVEKAYASAAA